MCYTKNYIVDKIRNNMKERMKASNDTRSKETVYRDIDVTISSL